MAVLPAVCLISAVKRGYLNKNTVELTVNNLGALQRRTIRIFGGPKKDGAVPMVVPNNQTYKNMSLLLNLVGGLKGYPAPAGWSDACILVPLAMYEQTGNTEILKDQYETMKKWCDFIIRSAEKYRGDRKLPKEVDQYLWNTGFHYGEWLIPSRTQSGLKDGSGMSISMKEGKKYISETYAYLSMKNFARISKLLNEEKNAAYYADMAEKMRQAFIDGIITEDGKMPTTVMGSYIIPLHYGLVPEKFRESFMHEILKKIEEKNDCLDTGFLGTPVILDTLCENGYQKNAYDLLFQDKCPSWLYEVDHGATTIWESWIATEPDGTPMALSMNHYAFGCVDDWMFRNINGVVPTEPGYRTFRIEPKMDERITSASRTFESEYGTIISDWKIENGLFTLSVAIPSNTSAEIVLPDGTEMNKGSGTYIFTCRI